MLRQKSVGPKGQSLLEVVVLIGLSLIIVTGLTVVTINGLKNSQFSQNQAQATRLAQESIDCVRSVRDKNLSTTLNGTIYRWYDEIPTQRLIWSAPSPTSSAIYLSLVVSGGNCSGIQGSNAVANDNSLPSNYATTFTRATTIQDYSGNMNQKRVTATVTWVDISGTHQSQIATILSKY